MTNILVVEDDKNAGSLLVDYLTNNGYNVTLARDGEDGWSLINENKYNLCILDIMLPKIDGISLAKKIKELNKKIPFIFLSARSLNFNKIEGFEAGADDYITKPYNMKELILRIEAILRRIKICNNSSKMEWSFNNSSFNYIDRVFIADNERFELSTKENEIIKLFCSNQNRTISRSFILENVWGNNDVYTSQSLDVYLTKIRKYFVHDKSIVLQNIHGFGYKFIVQEA